MGRLLFNNLVPSAHGYWRLIVHGKQVAKTQDAPAPTALLPNAETSAHFLVSSLLARDLYHAGTERRDTTYRIPALRGETLHVVSRCYVLN